MTGADLLFCRPSNLLGYPHPSLYPDTQWFLCLSFILLSPLLYLVYIYILSLHTILSVISMHLTESEYLYTSLSLSLIFLITVTFTYLQ